MKGPTPNRARRSAVRSIRSHSPAISTAATCLARSEEHTSELQSLMRISYAVFCLKKKKKNKQNMRAQTKTKKKETKIEHKKIHMRKKIDMRHNQTSRKKKDTRKC